MLNQLKKLNVVFLMSISNSLAMQMYLLEKRENKGKIYLACVILREHDIIQEFLWQLQF